MAEMTPMERLAGRAAYAVNQAGRVAWYMGHGYAMKRLRGAATTNREPARTSLSTPGEKRMRADLLKLFATDLANVEAGYYPAPRGEDGPLLQRLARSRAFFADLPHVHERREENRHSEVLQQAKDARRPRYYMQNFHFQSGGWMSEESALIYDTQVEVLFNGAASAMRRQLLVPLAELVRGRDQRQMHVADLACGTGRFLQQMAQAFPRLNAYGLDLSEAYAAEARRVLRRYPRVKLAVAKAEALPFPDASLDAITCVYLFHELPPKVRRAVMSEVARVLKPGGLFLLMDTLQLGDVADYDGLLDMFPQNFHEPYYAGYIREDLRSLAGKTGLALTSETAHFVSKASIFEKAA